MVNNIYQLEIAEAGQFCNLGTMFVNSIKSLNTYKWVK
jgi:hypothetical protein